MPQRCHKGTTKVLPSSVLFTIKIRKTTVHIYDIKMSGKLIFRRQKQNDFGMLKGRTPTTVPVDTFEIWKTYQRKSQKQLFLGM